MFNIKLYFKNFNECFVNYSTFMCSRNISFHIKPFEVFPSEFKTYFCSFWHHVFFPYSLEVDTWKSSSPYLSDEVTFPVEYIVKVLVSTHWRTHIFHMSLSLLYGTHITLRSYVFDTSRYKDSIQTWMVKTKRLNVSTVVWINRYHRCIQICKV